MLAYSAGKALLKWKCLVLFRLTLGNLGPNPARKFVHPFVLLSVVVVVVGGLRWDSTPLGHNTLNFSGFWKLHPLATISTPSQKQGEFVTLPASLNPTLEH